MTDVASYYPSPSGRVTRQSVPSRQGSTSNASRQRAAVKRMSECERLTGLTAEELAAFHAEQKARVLARYGVAA